MPKKTTKKKEDEAGLKAALKKLWSRVGPFATSLVLLLAAVLLIVGVKKMAPKGESRAAIRKTAQTSFVFRPPIPTRGTDVTIAPRGAASSPKEYSYRWWLNGNLVTGYNKAEFPGKGLSKRDTLRVQVLGPGGEVLDESSVTVANALPTLKKIDFAPLPLGEKMDLKVTVEAEDPDGDFVTKSFAWTVNGEPVVGEMEPVLRHENFKRGDKVRVMVTLSDGEGVNTVASAPVLVINSPPIIVSKPPAMVAEGLYTYQVEAKDPEGDRVMYSLKGSTPPGMSIDPATGLIKWEARTPEKPTAYAYQIIARDGHDGRCVQNVYLEFK